MDAAAVDVRPSPWYGWLALVLPATARRFRVADPELAIALSCAGGELADRAPDVEIVEARAVSGDAECAIVPYRSPELAARPRALRGVERFSRSALLKAQIAQARRELTNRGYPTQRVLTWDRGVAVRLVGQRPTRVQTFAHRFPLNAVVMGTRDGHTATSFDAAVEAAAAGGNRIRVDSILLAASGVLVAIGNVVVRVGVGPAARRILEQRTALETLRGLEPPPAVAERAPWVLRDGNSGLTDWSVERLLPGRRSGPVVSGRLAADCLEFLVGLHRCTGTGCLSLEDSAEVVAGVASPRAAAAIRSLSNRLDDSLADVPRGFGHGDFWSGNLLVDAGRLVGVVDWPSAGPGHLPLLDLLHLKANETRELTGRHLGSIVVDDLLGLVEAGGDALIREYCEQIEFEAGPALLSDLLQAYWLQALAHEFLDPDRDPHQSASRAWREVNVERVIRTFAGPEMATTARPRDGRSNGGRRRRAGHAYVVTDADELRALEPEWTALAERRGNPFVSPDWFWAWLRTCGRRDRPFVPILETENGRLRGIVPLVASGPRRLGVLHFAGAAFGDYFHPAAAPGEDETETAAAAAAALAARRREWGILVADYVDRESGWFEQLVHDGSATLAATRYHDRPSVYRSVALSGLDWDAYLATRSINMRGQVRRKLRALERDHAVAFRETTSSATLRRDMETLFDLHRQRWATDRSTVFSTPAARDFHLQFAEAALARNWLRLWTLEVDGAPVAAWYGWRLGDRYLYYQAGFDPAWSRYSPGFLLLAHTVRAAIEEGAPTYDMLLGDEPFKSRFADVERTAETLVLTRAIHPARALVAADAALRRTARRLPRTAYAPLRTALSPMLRRWPVRTAP